MPDDVQPKDAADYKLIGREGRLRVDAVPKILGATHYTIDLDVPGMLTALVLHRDSGRRLSRSITTRRSRSQG